jgi:hypothetical protein
MRVFIFAMIGLTSGCIDDHRAPTTAPDGGTEDCTMVTHDVSVRNPDDATSLPQDGCWDLYGKLSIEGSTITTLSMLGDIRSANDIEIVGTGLTTFDTKSTVNVWYGEVHVASNSKLTSFTNLTIQDGHVANVDIDANPALTNFELGGLEKIDTDLTVTNNPALSKVDISALETVTGNISIDNNAALATVNFGSLSSTTSIELINDPVLTSISGMPSTTVMGNLTLQSNAALTTLSGLTSLQSVGGSLKIDNNKALASLSGFPATSAVVANGLVVTNNAALTDMGGLSHFKVYDGVTITGNTSLAYCPAHEVGQCALYSGTASIGGNKSGTTTNCSYWCN